MSIGALVQARMSSTRLPGKVLRLLSGKPVLEYLLDALRKSSLRDQICIATSVDASDDPIERFCQEKGVACVRGSLDDVAGRCLQAAQHQGWHSFVRLCGDSPLLDYRLVDQAVESNRRTAADLVTNVWPRTFPRGQSVEVIRTESLQNAHNRFRRAHYEHVTTYFYENPRSFHIAAFQAACDSSHIRLVLDTPEDLRRLSSLLACLARPHWEYTWQDLVAIEERLAPPACRSAA